MGGGGSVGGRGGVGDFGRGKDQGGDCCDESH